MNYESHRWHPLHALSLTNLLRSFLLIFALNLLKEAWKFPLSWASMVSPPSKLKMFTGNVCVLLTSVSLKLSFRSPAEKKTNKQEQTNKHSSVTI